jgi:hypothetical protein
MASSFAIAYMLIKVRDDAKYGHNSMEHKMFYDFSTGSYLVTFIVFVPVCIYFWQRVLFIYMQILASNMMSMSTMHEEEGNEIIIDSSGDYGVEGQSVAFIAESFVKNVTLDM